MTHTFEIAPVTPTPTRTPSDRLDLIGRAQSGDGEAFNELFREHGERLLRQAQALCGNVNTAEDLVQETFIEAWRSLSRYRGGCQFYTWLCSILIHRHRNARRKRWPLPFSLLFDRDRDETEDFLAKVPDPGGRPDQGLELAEQAGRVLRSLERLPAKQRKVVYLRFYAEDSLEGIAMAVGCSVGTVKSRLFHGLERLRQMKALSEETTL